MGPDERAQMNVARPRAQLGSRRLANFVVALERTDALAGGTPGFTWRVQHESGAMVPT